MAGSTGGKRVGSRRGPRRKSGFQPALLLLALGITACVVAWGYLVYAAIDFGASARSGNEGAWWFLAIASAGAVACLFVGLMLVARVSRRLGITRPPEKPDQQHQGSDEDAPPPIGGRRAAR